MENPVTSTSTLSDTSSSSTVSAKDVPNKIYCLDRVDENSQGIKILLADDDEDSRQQIAAILRANNHDVYEVSNGSEALDFFDKYSPDLVLLDVVMPVMNGYTAAEVIKKQAGDQFVPVIFLTAITDNESLAACISSGGDDFLNKPVHPLILNAKIKAMQRIKGAYRKLDEYQSKTEDELETTEHLFSSLIDSNHEDIPNLDSWAIFPGHFSGDVQLSAKLENGDTYILLCDFTGHGLPAAIGTVFVADLFQSMTLKSIPPDVILNEINRKMNNILPMGRYCAAVMVAVNNDKNEVKVWNNGLPTVYLVNRERRIVEELESAGLPLGIVSTRSEDEPYTILPQDGYSLVFYSDGVTDAENSRGEMYSEERFVELIEQIPSSVNLCSAIRDELEDFVGDTELVDDLSVMVLNF